jgi:hypothetical protein
MSLLLYARNDSALPAHPSPQKFSTARDSLIADCHHAQNFPSQSLCIALVAEH